jgi:Skp family chaperone for outer membrane proteins
MQRTFFSYGALLSGACFYAMLMHAAVPAASPTPVKKDTKFMESRTAVSAKIAVVDVRRIVTQDPELLKTASEEWKELFGKIQEVLKPANKEIMDLEERYRKKASEIESLSKSGVSSKEMLRKKYEEEVAPLEYQLDMQYKQYQRFSYDELGKAQALLGPKIEAAIDDICAVQGWDFPINRESIPSKRLNKKFDITDDVLRLLNKNYADEKAKKAKAAAHTPHKGG